MIRECGMLPREEQSCDTGMIEAAIIVPRIELVGTRSRHRKEGALAQKIH